MEAYTAKAKQILDGARTQAEQLGHTFIGSEHLILSMLHAKQKFLARKESLWESQTFADKKREQDISNRIKEVERLIQSVYEDKVMGRVPEDICVELLEKYSTEKRALASDFEELQERQQLQKQDEADVEEFIRRLKSYAGAEVLTRKLCLELLEYVTVDENTKGREPRTIHIYYKFLDKGLTDKHNALA